jgi:uncharacterized protein (TIGR03435 family)
MRRRMCLKLDLAGGAGRKLSWAALLLPLVVPTLAPQILAQQSVTRQAATQSSPETRPKFEVASVKRCTDGGGFAGRSGGSQRSSPGRLALTCVNLADLIHVAYDQNADNRPINSSLSDILQPIKGGPAWIYSERYDVEAKAEGAPSKRTMMGPMLQALLEDRFQLKVHQETEEIPVYALTVAKGGAKLRPLEEGACTPIDSSTRATPPAQGQTPRCGTVRSGKNGTSKTLDVIGMSIGGFSKLLRNFLDRPIVDKTGIAGTFNFHLEYAPDELTPNGLFSGDDNPTVASANLPAGPSILAAIQQQLGLKLEQTKGPHGFLVIDHVEKPSEN